MFANLNGQEQLQQRKVRFADHNELSEDKSEYDWYGWIDHLISLEFHKAIEELEKEISELEKELEELENKNKKRLKSDTETDLKFIKYLTKHFNNPEEIIKELKSYVDEDKSRASNRMKSHIVLVRYFAEKVQIKMTEETNEFIKGIKIKYEKKTRTKRLRKKNPQSLYATSDKNTAKQYDEEAYDNKLKELRNLIIHSKNNFNHDIHVSLLIRVNNGIVGDIWDKPNKLGKSSHEWKLIHCVKELLKINHGNFKQILGSIEDLMEPSLKQYKELSPPINITQDQNLKTTALAEVSLQSKESFPGDTENDLQGTQPTPGGCKPLKREGTEGLAVPSAGTKIDMNSGQLQTTSHELQNPYDNAGMYSALGVAVVGFIAIGVMLCATGNPVLGGVFIAVPVISALILGIAKIYEEVSKKKEKKVRNRYIDRLERSAYPSMVK